MNQEETMNKIILPQSIPRNEEKTSNGCRKPRKPKPTPDNPGWTAKHHRRHFVRHDYHDHANETPDHNMLFDLNAHEPSSPNGSTNAVVAPFPVLLHRMLDGTQRDGENDIVSWKPHGRAFCVNNPDDFVRTVMPKYFRQSKISSFQRQLNLYGFARLTGPGPDKGAYYHEWFLRGRPDLTNHIQRTRVKGTGVRTSSNPKDEPNFYEMEPVGGQNIMETTDQMNVPSGRLTPDLMASPRPVLSSANDQDDQMPLPVFSQLSLVGAEREMSFTPLPLSDQPNMIGNSYALGVDNLEEMSHFLKDAGWLSDRSAV